MMCNGISLRRLPRLSLCWGFLCAIPGAWAGSVTFSNSQFLAINDGTNPPTKATPYPSSLVVTGPSGFVVSKVTVQLYGLTHSYPDDIDMLLVGPAGQNAVILAYVGGGHAVTNISLTLDDDAPSSLPYSGPLVSGTFKPTNRRCSVGACYTNFPTAPTTTGAPSLQTFKGTNPYGTWNLFVVDDSYPDGGSISNGWSLAVTVTVPLQIAMQQTNAVLSWPLVGSNFSLQFATSLTQAIAWSNVLAAPVASYGQLLVTSSIAGPARFFRLVQ